MHVGLVQVVVKPLVKGGINAPIFMELKDKRLKNTSFHSWLSSKQIFTKDPYFFNCYLDFTVVLICSMTTEALKLVIHVQGDEFHEFKIFCVYFKQICTNLNTLFLSQLPSNS